MAHGDAQEVKWKGNWQKEWVASTLHTTSKHGVSSITTADAHTSAAGSRLNWRLRRFKRTRPFRWKTKYGFCACAITFQTQSNAERLLTEKKKDRKCVLCFRWIRYFSPTSTDNTLMYEAESKVKVSLFITSCTTTSNWQVTSSRHPFKLAWAYVQEVWYLSLFHHAFFITNISLVPTLCICFKLY